jgi:hypothetical protein
LIFRLPGKNKQTENSKPQLLSIEYFKIRLTTKLDSLANDRNNLYFSLCESQNPTSITSYFVCKYWKQMYMPLLNGFDGPILHKLLWLAANWAFVLLRHTQICWSFIGTPLFTDLRNQPYRRADAVRRSVRRRFDDQNLRSVNGAEITMWTHDLPTWIEGVREWNCLHELYVLQFSCSLEHR